MSVRSPKMFDVEYKCKKKTSPKATPPHLAKVTVTPGKIVVVPMDKKIAPITFKPTDIASKPKRSKTNSTLTWLTLDFIQNSDATYSFINFKVDLNKMDKLVETLLFAWDNPISGTDLFKDNADELRPVHKPPPNAASKAAPLTMATRSQRRKILVDEEDDNSVHPSVDNDFGGSRGEETTSTAAKLQDIEKNTQQAQPIHKQLKEPKIKAKSGTSTYLSQAQKATENYRPVDSPLTTKSRAAKNDGMEGKAFYGSGVVSPAPPKRSIVNPRKAIPIGRGSAAVTQGSRKLHALSNEGSRDELERVPPIALQRKSLTSCSAQVAFDKTIKSSSGTTTSKGVATKKSTSSNSRLIMSRTIVATNEMDHGSYSLSADLLGRQQSTNTMNRILTTSLADNSQLPLWEYKRMMNIHNSCYMNATLQILAACPIFVFQLNEAVKSLGEGSSAIIVRINYILLWLSGKGDMAPLKKMYLDEMRTYIIQLDVVFEENNGEGQQDSDELLTASLGTISDECTGKGFRKRDSIARRSLSNTDTSSTKSPIKRLSSQCEESIEDGRKMKMQACCDPTDIYGIMKRYRQICLSCGDTKEKEGTEHRIYLEVKEEKEGSDELRAVMSVPQQLGNEVTHEETITDFMCENCEKKTEASGTWDILKCGEYLIIVLKRFSYNKFLNLIKIDSPVRVPLFLEMADFIERRAMNENGHNVDPKISVIDVMSMYSEEQKEHNEEEAMSDVMSEDDEEEKKKREVRGEDNLMTDETSGWVNEVEEKKEEDEADGKAKEQVESPVKKRKRGNGKKTKEEEKMKEKRTKEDVKEKEKRKKEEVKEKEKRKKEEVNEKEKRKKEEEKEKRKKEEEKEKRKKEEEKEKKKKKEEEKEKEVNGKKMQKRKAGGGDVESEKEKMQKELDEKRMQWRELLKDTDPAPPRNHILFRPVDDRWMKSYCQIFSLNCHLPSSTSYPAYDVFSEMRSQSSICKADAAPEQADIINIDADGNCFFRSISLCVTGSQEEYMDLRAKIVTFMCNFPHEFGLRMTGEGGQQYVAEGNKMFNDREWGTQCEIYGAATFFGVDIYTHHDRRWKQYRPLFEWTSYDGYEITRTILPEERTRCAIYLKNLQNWHFEVVKHMTPVAPDTNTGYRLNAALLHHGSTASSGHYTADVFDQTTEKWLHCDDDKVKEITTIEVLQNAMNNGYVLVYGKIKSTMGEENVDC